MSADLKRPPSWVCADEAELTEWLADMARGRCPTKCDADCEASCHDLHQVPWKRSHSPAGHGA